MKWLFFLVPFMALGQLPGSGEISIGDLRTEAGAGSVPYSLQGDGTSDFSVTPNPTSLSEFYGLSAGGTCEQILTIKYDGTSSVCANHTAANVWADSFTLGGATVLWSNSGCTTYAPTGWYSHNGIKRYWNSSTQVLGSASLC